MTADEVADASVQHYRKTHPKCTASDNAILPMYCRKEPLPPEINEIKLKAAVDATKHDNLGDPWKATSLSPVSACLFFRA